MNLKLVVASMSILGLVSCPVFATHSKHKHHKKVQTVAAVQEYKGYKDMPVLQVCAISQSAMIMNGMTQASGRNPDPCNIGWFNRIQFSGGVNVDIGKWGNRNANYQGVNYQRLSLNDAYLNLSANVSDWTKAFASLSYSNPTTNANPDVFNTRGAAEYSAAYSNNLNGSAANLVQLEQAYATIGNFDQSPIFFQVGKQFADFSRYEIHPITLSMTQVMSQTLATAIKLGFIASGFNGSIYAFDDPINKIGNSAKPTNYGASLGFDMPSDQFGWDIGAGYLYNIIGANEIAYNVNNFTGNGYHSRIGGVAAYGDINAGPFVLGVRYTQAVQRFNVNDLPRNGGADVNPNPPVNPNPNILNTGVGGGGQVVPNAGASGAKPWAAGIQAGYGYNAWDRTQNVYIGYQLSREAAGINLPRQRYLVGWGIDAWKNTSFGVEWDHEYAYSKSNGGSGNTTNLVSLRSSVKFG